MKAVIRGRLMEVAHGGMRRAFSVWSSAVEMQQQLDASQSETRSMALSMEEENRGKLVSMFLRHRLLALNTQQMRCAFARLRFYASKVHIELDERGRRLR